VYVNQPSLRAEDVAPDGPGGNADWLPSKKIGFGTSYTTASNVWFTLEGGRLSEVYYPRIDTPSVRNLDFVVTDGRSFAVRAQDASTTQPGRNLFLDRSKKGPHAPTTSHLCRNSNNAYLPFSPITSARHRPSTGPLPAATSTPFWPKLT
jgi:hypothetical protein